MPLYSSIAIIYNPNSTGPGKQLAAELYDQLKTIYPKLSIKLTPTKYAGHAEKLTYQIANKQKKPLIISVSGDGGYNEVINGAAKAYKEGRHPITSLLPAGNANDHHASMSSGDIVTAIKLEKTRYVDLLLLTASHQNQHITKRAHSYIGFGLTPQVGLTLTKAKINPINEALVVLKGLIMPRVVKLRLNGNKRSFDSITISNIDRMAKLLKLAKGSEPDDGLFEVNIVEHKNKLSLISFLLKATTTGTSGNQQTKLFELHTLHKTLVQADGEVFTLPRNTLVKISINEQQLCCIV